MIYSVISVVIAAAFIWYNVNEERKRLPFIRYTDWTGFWHGVATGVWIMVVFMNLLSIGIRMVR